MIALPLTCTFSTGNREILLTNNLNAAPDWRVHGAHVLWGGLDSQFVLGKPDFIRNRIRQRGGGFKTPQVP